MHSLIVFVSSSKYLAAVVITGCVCLSETIIFESVDVRSFLSSGRFSGIRVRFIYEGYQVKVMVTRQKSEMLSPPPLCLSDSIDCNCCSSKCIASLRGSEQHYDRKFHASYSVRLYNAVGIQ